MAVAKTKALDLEKMKTLLAEADQRCEELTEELVQLKEQHEKGDEIEVRGLREELKREKDDNLLLKERLAGTVSL